MSIETLRALLRRRVEPMNYAELAAHASRTAVDRAISTGAIVRIVPNAYADPLHAAAWLTRALAALAWAGERAALAGTSALAAYGAMDPPGTVAVVAPWETRPRAPDWLHLRRRVTMPETRIVETMRVSAPADAVIQAHCEMPPGSRAEAVFAPVRARLVTTAAIAGAMDATPRIRARAELARRLSAADDGAESFLEQEGGRRVLVGAEFGRLVRQHRVSVDGERYRLDAFDPPTLTAFEFDGAETHGTPRARRRDCVRDALLASVGILTVRFAYADVMDRPEWCRAVARRVLHARRATEAIMSVPWRTSYTSEDA